MIAVAASRSSWYASSGERHLRRDGDGVAGVHAHRVEVLDRADDDDVVGAVADDLELELVPAADGLLDEHLADRALVEPARDLADELVARRDEAAAVAAERERGSHDRRERDAVERVRRRDGARRGHAQPARLDGALEELAVLRALDRVAGRRRSARRRARPARPPLASSRARFSAVWPPIVGSSASGRSRRSTPATPSRSSGSR